MHQLMENPSRRDFLGAAGTIAATTGAVTLSDLAMVAAAEPKIDATGDGEVVKKEIVPGSPSPAYSRAVRLGRMVFVAGCVGTYPKEGKSAIAPDFRRQAEQTLRNLKASIEVAGSKIDNVLKCTCFLKDYADFKTFNEVYMSVFTKDPPARSTVVVKDFVVPGALLEVDCVCCVD